MGTQAHITVSETGEGIKPDEVPHIFSLNRTDRSRNRSTGGSGLGLAIAAPPSTLATRLIESHGGTITIMSQLEQGTTVTLTWPLEGKTTNVAETQRITIEMSQFGIEMR